MKKLIKLSLAFFLVISLFSISLLANKDAIIEMADQSVSENDRFQQSRLELGGQGLINLVDAEILNEKYSYEDNKEVKKQVNTEITSIESDNPDILSSYPGVKDTKELLVKFGNVLEIQRSVYTEDVYTKEYVTTKSLKKLYDDKAGEVTSFYLIRLDEADFETIEEYDAAIVEIEKSLATATKDDVLDTFIDFAKKYPGNESDPNGERTGVVREELSEGMLKIIDKYEYMQFSKKILNDEESAFFLLKTDKGDRLSFEESKERLTTLQFENAKSENPYLEMYLLAQLRAKNEVNFTKASDQRIYDLTNKEIIKQYQDAKEGDV